MLERYEYPQFEEEDVTQRKKFVRVLRLECVGKPYLWGAQGPDRFDCSGMVMYALSRAGMVLPDMTVQGLYEYFHTHRIIEAGARPGCLVFYGPDPEHVDHVMAVLDVWQRGGWPLMVLCGARGGNMNTVNDDIAYGQGAFVDVVLGNYWKSHYQKMIDPWRQ